MKNDISRKIEEIKERKSCNDSISNLETTYQETDATKLAELKSTINFLFNKKNINTL